MAAQAPAASTEEAHGSFKILYFAAAKSHVGKESESLPAPLEVGQLFDLLEQQYEGIRAKVLCYCKLAINWEYIDLEEDRGVVIQPGDEVGIIPPVSSG